MRELMVDAGVDGIEHGYWIEDSVLKKIAANNVYLVPNDPSVQGYINILKSQNQTSFDTPGDP